MPVCVCVCVCWDGDECAFTRNEQSIAPPASPIITCARPRQQRQPLLLLLRLIHAPVPLCLLLLSRGGGEEEKVDQHPADDGGHRLNDVARLYVYTRS